MAGLAVERRPHLLKDAASEPAAAASDGGFAQASAGFFGGMSFLV